MPGMPLTSRPLLALSSCSHDVRRSDERHLAISGATFFDDYARCLAAVNAWRAIHVFIDIVREITDTPAVCAGLRKWPILSTASSCDIRRASGRCEIKSAGSIALAHAGDESSRRSFHACATSRDIRRPNMTAALARRCADEISYLRRHRRRAHCRARVLLRIYPRSLL